MNIIIHSDIDNTLCIPMRANEGEEMFSFKSWSIMKNKHVQGDTAKGTIHISFLFS